MRDCLDFMFVTLKAVRKVVVPFSALAVTLSLWAAGSASAAVDGASVTVKVKKSGQATFTANTVKGRLSGVSFRSSSLRVNQAAVTSLLGTTIGSISFTGGAPTISVGLPLFTQKSSHSTYTWWQSDQRMATTTFAMYLRWGTGETGPVATGAIPRNVATTGFSLDLTAPVITTSKACVGVFSGTAYIRRSGAKPAVVPFSGRCS